VSALPLAAAVVDEWTRRTHCAGPWTHLDTWTPFLKATHLWVGDANEWSGAFKHGDQNAPNLSSELFGIWGFISY
jgi:hypothetical protein